jgi:hypothetical protein
MDRHLRSYGACAEPLLVDTRPIQTLSFVTISAEVLRNQPETSGDADVGNEDSI